LLVPVDVGKRSAMSMVADQLGEVIVDPFEFLLDRPGVDLLLDRVADAEEREMRWWSGSGSRLPVIITAL
jgi:hypothetical protein